MCVNSVYSNSTPIPQSAEKPCNQLRLSSVNSRHFVLFLDTCVARTGEKVTINALNDQWINGLQFWLTINNQRLTFNDQRKLLLELVLTIKDQSKLLFGLTVPNYAYTYYNNCIFNPVLGMVFCITVTPFYCS